MTQMNFISLTREELENIIVRSVEKAVMLGLAGAQPGIQQNGVDKPLSVSEAAEFLKISKSTLYGKVSDRLIPFMKKGQRLYFDRQELIAWLQAGKQKTLEEIEGEVNNSLFIRKGGRRA